MLLAWGFSGLGGCLYSCNYPPAATFVKNEDPCNADGKSELLSFYSVSGGSGVINFQLVMKLPCSGEKEDGSTQNFSLAFYDANNLLQPPDLTNAVYGEWKWKGAGCDKNQDNIDVINNSTDGLRELSEGAAITLGVGGKHPNRLYPYYIKIPVSNSKEGVIGTGSGCVNNVNMAPFVQDPKTLSPVRQGGNSVVPEDGEIVLDQFGYQLVPLGAPLFTYGTLKSPSGSGAGLKSTPGKGALVGGSFFEFQVKMKPGTYYVVLSNVPNPSGALFGNFSLSHVKVFRGNNQPWADYVLECGKDVWCGGKAAKVTVT